jgi:hypothetical protein
MRRVCLVVILIGISLGVMVFELAIILGRDPPDYGISARTGTIPRQQGSGDNPSTGASDLAGP